MGGGRGEEMVIRFVLLAWRCLWICPVARRGDGEKVCLAGLAPSMDTTSDVERRW